MEAPSKTTTLLGIVQLAIIAMGFLITRALERSYLKIFVGENWPYPQISFWMANYGLYLFAVPVLWAGGLVMATSSGRFHFNDATGAGKSGLLICAVLIGLCTWSIFMACRALVIGSGTSW